MEKNKVTINFAVEEEQLKQFENLCKESGISAASALTKVIEIATKEHKLPFQVDNIPFQYKTIKLIREEDKPDNQKSSSDDLMKSLQKHN